MTDQTKPTDESVLTVFRPRLERLADGLELWIDAQQRAGRRDAVWTIAKRSVLAILAVLFTAAYVVTYAQVMGATSSPVKPAVMVVPIEGQIGTDLASADKVVPLITKACDDPMARGMILRINSPGGSPTDGERIAAAIDRCRATHPKLKLTAVIERVGASAAYLIASRADEISANRFAMVGSIGAVMTSVDASAAAEQWGVTERTFASGPLKTANAWFTPNTREQDALMQTLVDGVAGEFRDQVIASRGDRLKTDTPELFSGRVWLAGEAVDAGLVDTVEVFEDHTRRLYPGLPTHTYRPVRTIYDHLGVKALLRDVAAEALADAREVQVR
jgi:protease-4